MVPSRVFVEEKEALRGDCWKESPSYKLSDIDEGTLDLLCEKFREDVFKKAGKKDPNQ